MGLNEHRIQLKGLMYGQKENRLEPCTDGRF